MREMTLEEMRMVTGGTAGFSWSGAYKDPFYKEKRNNEDKYEPTAKAIGNLLGDFVGGVVTGVCAAAAKGVVAKAACGVAGNTAGDLTTPAASAAANAVLHLGGQPGDYACGKIGICH